MPLSKWPLCKRQTRGMGLGWPAKARGGRDGQQEWGHQEFCSKGAGQVHFVISFLKIQIKNLMETA